MSVAFKKTLEERFSIKIISIEDKHIFLSVIDEMDFFTKIVQRDSEEVLINFFYNYYPINQDYKIYFTYSWLFLFQGQHYPEGTDFILVLTKKVTLRQKIYRTLKSFIKSIPTKLRDLSCISAMLVCLPFLYLSGKTKK